MRKPLRRPNHAGPSARSLRISLAAMMLVGISAVAGAVTTTTSAVALPSAAPAASPASDCSKNPPFNTDAGPVKALSVRGSALEVLIRGLKPKAKVALVNKAGRTVQTKRADSLGGLVFYKVKAGKGYRIHILPNGKTVKHITVHTNRSAPWDPKIYHQTIPDCGFGSGLMSSFGSCRSAPASTFGSGLASNSGSGLMSSLGSLRGLASRKAVRTSAGRACTSGSVTGGRPSGAGPRRSAASSWCAMSARFWSWVGSGGTGMTATRGAVDS